jgi:DNA primase
VSASDEIKARIDIYDLISESVVLKKAGRNFTGLCPFHNEKTPSFHVSPERQTWHCFGGCATGGDIFTFVMRRDNVDFREALRTLADRAGVRLGSFKPEQDEKHARLIEANEAAAAYYNNLLGTKAGSNASAYLASRGLDSETIEVFQLGYAPEAWEGLKSHLSERGFSDAELLQAGLLVESERGGYDRFRNRLMFPIRDDRGRVVGFGGRALADEEGAKYINTPQTDLFDKSSILYALDRAKDTIRRDQEAIVVEGYMDVIAAHQHGIRNAVASMGTALTEKQMRALDRLKCRVLLALDADAAGIEATLRALREAADLGMLRGGAPSVHPDSLDEARFEGGVEQWSKGALKGAVFNCYVISLEGKDPDEMIRADRATWDAAVEHATPFLDHVFSLVAARSNLSQPTARADMVRQLAPFIRLIDDPVIRGHWVQRLANKARVNEKTVEAELQQHPRPKTSIRARDTGRSSQAIPDAYARDPIEEFLLALLLHHPELRAEARDLVDAGAAAAFSLGENAAVFEAWSAAESDDAFRTAVPEDLRHHVERVWKKDLPYMEGTLLRDAIRDCVARIQLRRLSVAKQVSAASISDQSTSNDMRRAVSEAREAIDSSTDGDEENGATDLSEFASVLVEDMRRGMQLHQPKTPTRPAEEHDPSQVEAAPHRPPQQEAATNYPPQPEAATK